MEEEQFLEVKICNYEHSKEFKKIGENVEGDVEELTGFIFVKWKLRGKKIKTL